MFQRFHLFMNFTIISSAKPYPGSWSEWAQKQGLQEECVHVEAAFVLALTQVVDSKD